MKSNLGTKVRCLLLLSVLTDDFLTPWSVFGFHVGHIPSAVRFLRTSRSTDASQQHRCLETQTDRHELAATHESVRPCNISRLLSETPTTTLASSFALRLNLGTLREAVSSLRRIFQSRADLTHRGPHYLFNATRLPVEPRHNHEGSNHRPFDQMADDLRRYYVSINEAERHEVSMRSRRINTLERDLCFVRGNLNKVLCTLHAALEDTAQVDIAALESLVRYLSQMRDTQNPGTVDVWAYLLFQNLETYLQKMHEFVTTMTNRN